MSMCVFEIVNVQGMIEDTHERWLDQEEEYMEERRLFTKTTVYTMPHYKTFV